MTGPTWIGVDVGGTKVLAGAVDLADGAVLRTSRRATPGPETGHVTGRGTGRVTGRGTEIARLEKAIADAVLDAAGGERVAGVGVAAAGFVDARGERVRFAPHLPWRGESVRSRLATLLDATVALDNDATCATLAEATYGAARGSSSAVLVTLGTGIGGGLVIGGEVVRGAQGMAGEFGHMRVVPDGRACECGRCGCWEQYCSGRALVRAARDEIGRRPSVLEELCGGRPEDLTGPMVTAAAEQGDLVALDAFASVGDWLGVGLANLVAALDPACVVVGGGVASAGERLLEPARRALVRSLVGAGDREVPPVLAARLGPAAGLVGAALLARERARG